MIQPVDIWTLSTSHADYMRNRFSPLIVQVPHTFLKVSRNFPYVGS